MDQNEAARLLGVADTEVVDIRAHAGWWEARHHDMASHEEAWRPVPGEPDVPDDAPVGEAGPELVDLPAGSEVKPAAPRTRKGSR